MSIKVPEPSGFDDRRQPPFNQLFEDSEIDRFTNFFFQAQCANIVTLHSKAMKSGFIVNGRRQFDLDWAVRSI